MILIRFCAQGANSLVGGFQSGDIARVPSALAKHLVEEAEVAKYVSAHANVEHASGSAHATQEPQPQPTKARRGRAKT